jgi:hypothetical protein
MPALNQPARAEPSTHGKEGGSADSFLSDRIRGHSARDAPEPGEHARLLRHLIPDGGGSAGTSPTPLLELCGHRRPRRSAIRRDHSTNSLTAISTWVGHHSGARLGRMDRPRLGASAPPQPQPSPATGGGRNCCADLFLGAAIHTRASATLLMRGDPGLDLGHSLSAAIHARASAASRKPEVVVPSPLAGEG